MDGTCTTLTIQLCSKDTLIGKGRNTNEQDFNDNKIVCAFNLAFTQSFVTVILLINSLIYDGQLER